MDEQHQPRRTTAEQRGHFWSGAQDTIAAIVEQAELYLPDAYVPDEMDDNDEALDPKAVEEILNVLYQARTAADTAAGAYVRVLRGVRRNGENNPLGHRPQAVYQQPVQQASGGMADLPRDWR